MSWAFSVWNQNQAGEQKAMDQNEAQVQSKRTYLSELTVSARHRDSQVCECWPFGPVGSRSVLSQDYRHFLNPRFVAVFCVLALVALLICHMCGQCVDLLASAQLDLVGSTWHAPEQATICWHETLGLVVVCSQDLEADPAFF